MNNLQNLKYKIVYEQFENNPFLEKLYANFNKKHNYCFQTQLNFMISYIDMINKNKYEIENIIYDRYIYDSMFVFSKYFLEKNMLSLEEYNLLLKTFELLQSNVKKPDLVIYLQCDENVALTRIKKRNRIMEKDINTDYLKTLDNFYEIFLALIFEKLFDCTFF